MANEYYGMPTTPNDDYLAHYGIKGMKWGVRKAQSKYGAAAERALSRQYSKAQRKLAKLEKRAASGKKYAKRAAMLGAGAAAAGGLAAAGTKGVGTALRKSARIVEPGARAVGGAMTGAGKLVGNLANAIPGKQVGMSKFAGRLGAAGNRISSKAVNAGQAMRGAGNSVIAWGAKNTLAKSAAGKYGQLAAGKGATFNTEAYKKAYGKIGNISNNTLARIGAGAVGAGLAGAAGYNAYRAATTKRAAKKAAQFRAEMNKAFAGTKYANAPRTPQKKKRRG